jgi:hypothetical protein
MERTLTAEPTKDLSIYCPESESGDEIGSTSVDRPKGSPQAVTKLRTSEGQDLDRVRRHNVVYEPTHNQRGFEEEERVTSI